MPEVTLPAMPELTLTAIKQQLSARILECDRGGFIVLFEGHGMAACTGWDEALDAIERAGIEYLGVKKMEMPSISNGWNNERAEPARDRGTLNGAMHSIGAALVAVGAMAAFVLGVKIA